MGRAEELLGGAAAGVVPTKRDAVSVTAAQSVVPGVAVLHQLLPADGEAHNADRKRQPGQQAERQGTDAVPTAAGVDRKDWFRPRSADRGEQAAEPGRLKATERTAEAATPERRRRTSRAARGAPDWTWRQLGVEIYSEATSVARVDLYMRQHGPVAGAAAGAKESRGVLTSSSSGRTADGMGSLFGDVAAVAEGCVPGFAAAAEGDAVASLPERAVRGFNRDAAAHPDWAADADLRVFDKAD